MTYDVIIATKDRKSVLLNCLESIGKQSILPRNLIIVDASSTPVSIDEVKEKVHPEINIRVITSLPGLTIQRNIGINYISSDIVSFLDDDVVLKENYFEEILNIFEKDENGIVGGATGKLINQERLNVISTVIRRLFFMPELKRGEVKKSGANNAIDSKLNEILEIDWLPGFNQNYRSEVVKKYKFDENYHDYSYLEDVDFSYRVKKEYKLLYVPKAQLFHFPNVAAETRLKVRQKRKMYVINYYYFFKKNLNQSLLSFFAHYWSYVGLVVQAIILKRNMSFFVGTIEGIATNLLGKNPLLKMRVKNNV